MHILFTCPHCGTKSQVAGQYAGQSGPCAACGKPVSIPYPVGDPSGVATGAAVGMSVVVKRVVVFGAIFACGGIVAALLLLSVHYAREDARRMRCYSNLKQISLAMHNYHDVHGSLPPAYLADKDGKPMHSWRVLLLPYMEQQNLYDQYKFDEPWDSPNNLHVAEMIPELYRCPSDPEMGTTTDYMVIVGKETPFDGAKPCKFDEISDGSSNTIMVIEVKGSNVKWTQPMDIDFATSSFKVFNGPSGEMGSKHSRGALAGMCDGSVRYLGRKMQPDLVRAFATKAGGEVVPGY